MAAKNEVQASEIRKQVKSQKTIWVGKPRFGFEKEYEKGKQLGNAGQYGVTYRCKHKKKGEIYAVKYLNKNRFYRISQEHRHKYMAAMKDEIEILQTVNHKNIIHLHEVWEDKTTLYLVMEECKGGELFNRIVAKGKYSERAAAVIIKQLLSALRYMHDDNKIAHCDIKPENILFLTEDEDSPIKVIDFGMAKVLPRLQYLTQLCGTPWYTAPEVIKQKKYNHSCDLWSVGIILFIMIYGYPPFSADPQKMGQNERNEVYKKIIKGFNPVIKKTSVHGFGPWFPDHIPTSAGVRNLIARLLTRPVRKRYTAREAVQDPWIVNRNKHSDETHLEKHMVSRLVHFNQTRQFKVVITRIFRNQFYKMRPEHFHQLEQLFTKFDKDGNGVLSFDEFSEAIESIDELNLEKKHLITIYEQLKASQPAESEENEQKDKPKNDDEDVKETEDGQKGGDKMGIRFNDLLNALVYDYLIACDERLYDAFRKLDDDNDGKITTKELKDKLQQIDPLGEWDKAIAIIEEQSLEQDGVIDYEEFLMNLHPNFEEQAEWIPDMFKKMPSIRMGKGSKE